MDDTQIFLLMIELILGIVILFISIFIVNKVNKIPLRKKIEKESSLGIQNNKSFMYATILLIISLLWISAFAYCIIVKFANNDDVTQLKDKINDYNENLANKINNIIDEMNNGKVDVGNIEWQLNNIKEDLADLEDDIDDISIPPIIINPPY